MSKITIEKRVKWSGGANVEEFRSKLNNSSYSAWSTTSLYDKDDLKNFRLKSSRCQYRSGNTLYKVTKSPKYDYKTGALTNENASYYSRTGYTGPWTTLANGDSIPDIDPYQAFEEHENNFGRVKFQNLLKDGKSLCLKTNNTVSSNYHGKNSKALPFSNGSLSVSVTYAKAKHVALSLLIPDEETITIDWGDGQGAQSYTNNDLSMRNPSEPDFWYNNFVEKNYGSSFEDRTITISGCVQNIGFNRMLVKNGDFYELYTDNSVARQKDDFGNETNNTTLGSTVILRSCTISGDSLTNMGSTFLNVTCSSLDLTNLDTSRVTTMASCFQSFNFYSEYALKIADLKSDMDDKHWIYTTSFYSGLATAQEYSGPSTNYSHLYQTTLEGYKTQFETSLSAYNTMIDTSNNAVLDLDLSIFDGSSLAEVTGWYAGHPTGTLKNMFKFARIDSLTLKGFSLGNSNTIESMFERSNISSCDFGNMDTSLIQDMYKAFDNYTSDHKASKRLYSDSDYTVINNDDPAISANPLTLSSWDTSSVTRMSYMFNNAFISSINLSGWNTSNTTSMAQMFQNVRGLSKINVNHFKGDSLTTIDAMFKGCSAKEMKASFDTPVLQYARFVFESNFISDFADWKIIDIGRMDFRAIQYGANFFGDMCIHTLNMPTGNKGTLSTLPATSANRLFGNFQFRFSPLVSQPTFLADLTFPNYISASQGHHPNTIRLTVWGESNGSPSNADTTSVNAPNSSFPNYQDF